MIAWFTVDRGGTPQYLLPWFGGNIRKQTIYMVSLKIRAARGMRTCYSNSCSSAMPSSRRRSVADSACYATVHAGAQLNSDICCCLSSIRREFPALSAYHVDQPRGRRLKSWDVQRLRTVVQLSFAGLRCVATVLDMVYNLKLDITWYYIILYYIILYYITW